MDKSIEEVKKLIPSYVFDIAEKLQENNYEAFLVGGSVRDILLGKIPGDYDIATNAYPEKIQNIFDKSIATGAQFGTITVIGNDESGEKFDVEVTTYRSDADYFGGRWPTKVEFARSIGEDLSRRDFTINAIALDLQKFDEYDLTLPIQTVLEDPFAGIKDLEAKKIIAVGEALDRFTEDGLRAVRACRLASQLEFEIDEKTFEAIKSTNHVTKQVSIERFKQELEKLLYKSSKPSHGLRLMAKSGILELFIPELVAGVDVTQPQFHVHDVFEHTLNVVDAAEDRVKLAALFHDIAKPITYSKDDKGVHFYGHDVKGSEMTKEIMRRLRFPNHEIEKTSKLVRWHMFYYPSTDWRNLHNKNFDWSEADERKMQEHLEENRDKTNIGGWTDSAIRRLIINVGGEENIDDLMRLRIADATGNPMSTFNPEELKVLSNRISEVRAKDMALKVTDLDISGKDLMHGLGLQPGKKLGDTLKHLLNEVIEDPNLNKKENLLKIAKDFVVDSRSSLE